MNSPRTSKWTGLIFVCLILGLGFLMMKSVTSKFDPKLRPNETICLPTNNAVKSKGKTSVKVPAHVTPDQKSDATQEPPCEEQYFGHW